ncbi:methyltransferase domain-containing protein [Fodinibius halophilus]|uniref:Methyltransferase domain-containing protein n=1 Tax=Fodinibius halophilus TaxID=1736908 RepID=A0A6M1T9D2_9BACT|nr:methyltransferase domain-containing protein [Fodinibius halophilus]NGP86982.1 methyltransferase domain-containing protein [Fodinibius halophilus]
MNQQAVNDKDLKEKIAVNFGSAAPEYHKQATLQKEAAERLIASLKPWRDILPKGPIIELGCGTGFVTKGLATLYPNREIVATDLSPRMVEYCQEQLSDFDNLTFAVRDAENVPEGEPEYALTISGFTAQWFKDPAQTLGKWLEAIKPGGLLLTSFPGNESFPEWKQKCEELGLPYTGNELPDIEELVVKMSLGPAQIDYYEDTVTQTFESAEQFFREFKYIGASTQKKGRALTPKELSLLIDHWNESADGDITVSYHLVFLAVKRDYDS